jgi:hypothetical protein
MKNTKIPSQDSQCARRDSNRAPPEYKFRALPLDKPVREMIWEMHRKKGGTS